MGGSARRTGDVERRKIAVTLGHTVSDAIWLLMRDLGLSLVLALGYFGLLALLARRLFSLEPKQATLYVAISLPLRLGLLGMGMIWLLRRDGLIGAVSMVLGLWLGRFLIGRIHRRGGYKPSGGCKPAARMRGGPWA